MAGLIKSAISKQKEYLADASAVQFTRNPEGIGDALKIIGGHAAGTFVETARAEEMSHLFFGQVKHRLWSGFATHPPIEERIERIDPQWDGQFLAPSITERNEFGEEPSDDPGHQAALGAIAVAATAVATSASGIGAPSPNSRLDDASQLLEETQNPLGAMALVLTLAWDPAQDGAQERAVVAADIDGLADLVRRWREPLRSRSPAQRLHVLELCLTTLRGLSEDQYRTFRELLLSWISADGKTTLSEWCLFQMVRHYLDIELLGARPARPKYRNLTSVSKELAIALGTLAHLTEENTEHAFQRGEDFLQLKLIMPPARSLSVAQFSEAADTLAACYPLNKIRILKAMAAVAVDDGDISGLEITLVKAMAMVMDCPVPDAVLEAHGIKLSTPSG